jgi:uncharacterized membrane protein YccF (DUF307 family)
MSFAGNLLWFVFGGFLMALEWYLLGAVFALTVVGLPFAHAAWRIAPFAATPFGKRLVDARLLGERRLAGTGLVNALWVVLAGFWLALGHCLTGLILCGTVMGIPFGLAHFKLAGVAFAPLGKRAVPTKLADEAENRATVEALNARLAKAPLAAAQ